MLILNMLTPLVFLALLTMAYRIGSWPKVYIGTVVVLAALTPLTPWVALFLFVSGAGALLMLGLADLCRRKTINVHLIFWYLIAVSCLTTISNKPIHYLPRSPGEISPWVADVFNKWTIIFLQASGISKDAQAEALVSFFPLFNNALIFVSNYVNEISFSIGLIVITLSYGMARRIFKELPPLRPGGLLVIPRVFPLLVAALLALRVLDPQSDALQSVSNIGIAVYFFFGAWLLSVAAASRPRLAPLIPAVFGALLISPSLCLLIAGVGLADNLFGFNRFMRNSFESLSRMFFFKPKTIIAMLGLVALAVLFGFAPFTGRTGAGLHNVFTPGIRHFTDLEDLPQRGIKVITEEDRTVFLLGDRSYAMDKYEYPNIRGAMPAAGVAWREASGLCAERGQRLCRFWEYTLACGTEKKLTYLDGSRMFAPELVRKKKCNLFSDAISPSGTFEECVNEYELYDLTGNVAQWMADESDLGFRIFAGSSFLYGDDSSTKCYFAMVIHSSQWDSALTDDFGFRCCSDIAVEAYE